MACLLSYPCVDFVVSVIRRMRKGLSPLQADNGHLHNRLYRFYAQKFKSRVTPNSLTGLTISGASSGVCLIIYALGWIPVESNAWFGVFGLQFAVYLIALSRLGSSQMDESAAMSGVSG